MTALRVFFRLGVVIAIFQNYAFGDFLQRRFRRIFHQAVPPQVAFFVVRRYFRGRLPVIVLLW